jgi:hypothetical protein
MPKSDDFSYDRRAVLVAGAVLAGAAVVARTGAGAAERQLGVAAPPTAGSAGVADPAAPAERASGIVREYDAQGNHRTGTEVDSASAKWLAERVRQLGIEVQLESFPLDRVDPGDAWIESAGRRIGGVPLFDAGSTGATAIEGRIGPLGGDRPIALVAISSADLGALSRARASRHTGLVLVPQGARAGLTLLNAPAFREPSGPPALQVSSAEADWLRARVAEGAEARLSVPAARTGAQAHNVVAFIPGRVPGQAPLGVITPRSGWWSCASERGGGIVAWLETAAALAAAQPSRDVHLIATSGHELGHLGLEAFLAARPGLAARALAWIHFGANIGAAGQLNRVQAGDQELLALARAALATQGLGIDQLVPPEKAPSGEAHTIHSQGGRYISLVGDNPLFHQPADRWPEAIDAERVARHAAAFAQLAVTLAANRSRA